MVNQILPKGKRAGILKISGSTLTVEHLSKARVPEGTPIGTTEGGREFSRVILNNERELDVEAARCDNVSAARKLIEANEDIGAIVLECTNMIPYAFDIRLSVGLPVFSKESFVSWFQSGLSPRCFETENAA